MKKEDVIAFFDRCAPRWDEDMIRDEEIIAAILDNGGIREGIDVLDVACGTGVLLLDYVNRGVNSVTGIDISPEMVKIARSKFPEITVLCGDVETEEFDRQFDAVMVYNAFPHFPDPAHLIEVLAKLVKPGGRLSVAHSMSRAALANHHKRVSKVSIDLPEAGELTALFQPFFEVDRVISNDRMYQVSGVRRDGTIHSHGGSSHAHSHEHDSEAEPLDETMALMRFMVRHNDAHAQELAQLADRLRTAGRTGAYRKVMDAVAGFDTANARLAAVLQELASGQHEGA